MSPNFTARNGVGVGEDAVKIVSSGLTDYWKFRDAVRADTAYDCARRPGTAFLGRRVRKSYARNVMARAFTASYNGASPNFTARNGVDGSKDAAKIVFSVCQSGGFLTEEVQSR